MGLGDPFAQAASIAQSPNVMSQGISDLATAFSQKQQKEQELQKNRTMAFDMLKKVGMVNEKTEEPSIDQLTAGLKDFGKQHGKDVQINYGDNPDEAKKNILGIYKALNIPMPQGKTTTSLNLAPGTQYDPMKGDVSFEGSKPVDPIVKEMREQRLQMNQDQQEQKKQSEQDKLEKEARQQFISVRGDSSIAGIEKQRDAAIQGYTTLKDIRKEGRLPNSFELQDVLAQTYRSRTGAAPTNEIMKDLFINTLGVQANKVEQFFSGKATPATTEDIANKVEDFLKNSGTQLDKMHDTYMEPRLVKPSNLSDEKWKEISKNERGMRFSDAMKQYEGNTKSDSTSKMLDATGLSSQGKASQTQSADYQSYLKAISQ